MEKKRKIAKVVNKVSSAEAEAADDEYWSKANGAFRLKEFQR